MALLAATALIRNLPEAGFLRAVRAGRAVLLVFLGLLIIPYLVQTIRNGIYPQLERPWQILGAEDLPVAAIAHQSGEGEADDVPLAEMTTLSENDRAVFFVSDIDQFPPVSLCFFEH